MSTARTTTMILLGLTPFAYPGSESAAQEKVICKVDRSMMVGTTTISDRSDGVSGDGLGPYRPGPGVPGSVVGTGASLAIVSPRKLTVNLSRPVPGGGGTSLGTIADDGSDGLPQASGLGQGIGLDTQLKVVGDSVQSLLNIPIGQSVDAAQLNVRFHIDGRFHILQMGPQPFGHCHAGANWQPNLMNGRGTSSGTIYRASKTRWVIDLPAGSVGRLFDVHDGPRRAVDKGLYYTQLHYEIADAVPPVNNVLQRLTKTESGAAIVARYRALKRDSASAYFFDESMLNAVGYTLLGNNRPGDAVTVFHANLEEYPESPNAFDGLGEAYLAIGDTTKAVANYKRAVQLDPKNQNAADILRRITSKP